MEAMNTEKMYTEKLYYEDAYKTEFAAKIVSVNYVDNALTDNKKTIEIVLDRTLFFPEAGGQKSDIGILRIKEKAVSVEDVKINEGVIYHFCSCDEAEEELENLIAEGGEVEGKVDFSRRFDQMQQHSGEHILSGLIYKAFGYNNTGFHLGLDEVTMDFDGDISKERMSEFELEANRIIWKNLPIKTYFPDESELDKILYRSKKEITEEALRIVEIPGVDTCACCAPHVSMTGEIGIIKLIGLHKHKAGVRLSIACGSRAFKLFAAEHGMLDKIANSLTTSIENIPDRFERIRAENSAIKLQNISLKELALDLSVKDPYVYEENGREHVLIFCDKGSNGEEIINLIKGEICGIEINSNDIRNTVNKLTKKHNGYCVIFSQKEEGGYNYCIGSSELDCKLASLALSKAFGAKGGGSGQMVQGTIPESIEREKLKCVSEWVTMYID